MDQERTVNKVCRDMKMCNLIPMNETGELRESEVKFFLSIAFTAGFDHKNKANNCQKRVIQESREHKKLQEYPSMNIARKAVGMSKAGMINAIKNKLLTRKGYYFRYAEDEDTGGSKI